MFKNSITSRKSNGHAPQTGGISGEEAAGRFRGLRLRSKAVSPQRSVTAEHVVLDKPYDLPTNASLMVTRIPWAQAKKDLGLW